MHYVWPHHANVYWLHVPLFKKKEKKKYLFISTKHFYNFFSVFCNCVDRNKKRVVKLKRRKTNFLSFECSCKYSCVEMHSCLFESLSLLSFFVFLQTLTDIGCFLFLHFRSQTINKISYQCEILIHQSNN